MSWQARVVDAFLGLVVAWFMVMSAVMGAGAGDGFRPAPGRAGPPWASGRSPFEDSPQLGWLGAACLAAGVALAVRRRWPRASWIAIVATGAAYLLLGGALPGAVVLAGLGLFTLVRRVPPAVAAGCSALLVPMFWARFSTRPALGLAEAETWLRIASSVVWAAVPALVGMLTAGRRAARVRGREEELARVAYEERLRIARDIHDVVGHSLSMIALQSGVALRVLDADPGQARTSLEAIRAASRTSMDELRRTLAVFRSPEGATLAPAPGLADIPALVDAVRATGRAVVLTDRAPAGVPRAVQLVAHRVVQEGLTNAVRHAPGSPVSVVLDAESGGLVVQVADAGPRRRQPVVEGIGLRGMRERVASVGGSLTVSARDAGGVLVEARLPLGDAV